MCRVMISCLITSETQKVEIVTDQFSISLQVLTIIHLDEVTHVSAGHRWLTYLCDETNQSPIEVFRKNVGRHFAGKLKGPFNANDRSKAGLTREWYEDLVGEKAAGPIGVGRSEIPGG